MTSSDIKMAVIKELQKLPVYKVSPNGIQHTVRCPYCGDSKTPTHAHFSIKIDCDDPETPMLYRCFRCATQGLLTSQVLEDLGIHVDDLDLKSLNRKVAKKNKFTGTKIEDFDLVNYDNNYDRVRYKIEYINRRLGTHFDSRDIVKLNIVPSILDFMYVNKLDPTLGGTYSEKQMRFYDRNFVGFLSYNKNLLTLRDVTNTASQRYVKITLNKKNDDSHTFYSIKNSIDLLYTDSINIHIAEGTMDILGVYANINNCNLEGNLYYAVCGFDYSRVIRAIIRMGINTGINLHIYADNDKSDEMIYNQFRNSELVEWLDSLTIHRNELDKDYGVSQIKDNCRIIRFR